MQLTCSQVRQALKALMDRSVAIPDVVMVHRRHVGDVALIAADELKGLLETPHIAVLATQSGPSARGPQTRPDSPVALHRPGRPGGHHKCRPPSDSPRRLSGWPPATRSFWMTCSIRSSTIAAQQVVSSIWCGPSFPISSPASANLSRCAISGRYHCSPFVDLLLAQLRQPLPQGRGDRPVEIGPLGCNSAAVNAERCLGRHRHGKQLLQADQITCAPSTAPTLVRAAPPTHTPALPLWHMWCKRRRFDSFCHNSARGSSMARDSRQRFSQPSCCFNRASALFRSRWITSP